MTQKAAEAHITLSKTASANAPFVYFDGVPNFGVREGVANITLEALSYITEVDGVILTERVVVAHLRTNATGLRNLRKAIDGIELLANPVEGEHSN